MTNDLKTRFNYAPSLRQKVSFVTKISTDFSLNCDRFFGLRLTLRPEWPVRKSLAEIHFVTDTSQVVTHECDRLRIGLKIFRPKLQPKNWLE